MLPSERRTSVTNDVNEQGVIAVPITLFNHVYPNKYNVYERVEQLEEQQEITVDVATQIIQQAAIPFLYTTTQEKLLKVDYTKGVINKKDITERFGLSPETNRIRFETLPHGWNEERLRNDPATQRPFEGFNMAQVERMRQSRKATYGAGWDELQEALEEREALADTVDV
jgi:hypothetical protein